MPDVNQMRALLQESHGALAEDWTDPILTGADMDALLPPLSAATGVEFRAVWCSVTDDRLHGGWYVAVRVDDAWHTASTALSGHLDGSAPEADLLDQLTVDAKVRAVLVGDRLLDLTGLAIDEGPRVGRANCAIRRTWPAHT